MVIILFRQMALSLFGGSMKVFNINQKIYLRDIILKRQKDFPRKVLLKLTQKELINTICRVTNKSVNELLGR